MKSKTIQQNRKRTSSITNSGSARNSIKCSFEPAESEEHREMKIAICSYFYYKGIHFRTEASFPKGRADIIVDDWFVGIEVLRSENINDFLKKDYPFISIPISSSELNNDLIMTMLEDLYDSEGGNAQHWRNTFIRRYGGTQ